MSAPYYEYVIATNEPMIQQTDAAAYLETVIANRCAEQADPDSLPVPESSIVYAAKFLVALNTLPNPQIESGEDGSLGLFWRDGHNVAYIDLLPNNYVRLLVRAEGYAEIRRVDLFEAIFQEAVLGINVAIRTTAPRADTMPQKDLGFTSQVLAVA